MFLGLVVLLAACNDDAGDTAVGACIDDVELDCEALVEPAWEPVFTQVLQPSCGVGGTTCHGATGGQGGLDFTDAALAHAMLTDDVEGDAYVIPGDAACSELIVRLDTSDPDILMPPGAALSAEARCAVRLWVDAGAPE